MAFKLIVLLSTVFAVSHAIQHYAPGPTPWLSPDINPNGWTPRPTKAPELDLRHAIKQRGLENTCAYVGGVPLACPPNQYCAFFTAAEYFACCSVDNSGSFASNCGYTTTCIDVAQSSSLCAIGQCPGQGTALCGVSGVYPSCATFVVYGTSGTYTNPFTTLGCDSSSVYLTASNALLDVSTTTAFSTSVSTTTLTPSTSTTTSTTTSPSTTSYSTSLTTSSTSTTTPPSSTTVTPSASATTTQPVSTSGSTKHTAAIAGGTVGGVAGLALLAGLIGFVLYRMRVKKREAEDDAPEMSGHAYPSH